jgi:hypothetical protein
LIDSGRSITTRPKTTLIIRGTILGRHTSTNVKVIKGIRGIKVRTDLRPIGMSHPIIRVKIGTRIPIRLCTISMGIANGQRRSSLIITRQSVMIVGRKGIEVKHSGVVLSILTMTQTKPHVSAIQLPLGKATSKVEVEDEMVLARRESSTGKWGAFP